MSVFNIGDFMKSDSFTRTEVLEMYLDMWDDLPYEDRLAYLCAAIHLICESRLSDDPPSYVDTVYDVLDLDEDAYVPLHTSGFMKLFSSIFNQDELSNLILSFIKENKLLLSIDYDFTEEDVKSWLARTPKFL